MTEKNNKVPIAILSCFLIAFILQGVLKISGILVFEKALGWEIFSIIDSHKWMELLYYSTIMTITLYCLSFALTSRPYSNKWYHYILLILTSLVVNYVRLYIDISVQLNIIIDIATYIVVPLIINFTTNRKYRIFDRSIQGIVLTITIQICLYFCYLGLEYWGMVLNSILPIDTMWLPASVNFLIQFDEYIALITFMLSLNYLINYVKERDSMRMPLNIATDEAKKKELEEKKAKKNSKKNEK